MSGSQWTWSLGGVKTYFCSRRNDDREQWHQRYSIKFSNTISSSISCRFCKNFGVKCMFLWHTLIFWTVVIVVDNREVARFRMLLVSKALQPAILPPQYPSLHHLYPSTAVAAQSLSTSITSQLALKLSTPLAGTSFVWSTSPYSANRNPKTWQTNIRFLSYRLICVEVQLGKERSSQITRCVAYFGRLFTAEADRPCNLVRFRWHTGVHRQWVHDAYEVCLSYLWPTLLCLLCLFTTALPPLAGSQGREWPRETASHTHESAIIRACTNPFFPPGTYGSTSSSSSHFLSTSPIFSLPLPC